ncbi:MAG: PilZ domain-containing protein [Candidatus Latescibacterota bacterium]|nr:PilZ domain-containing protein [Candidatus Latescibacterota bacterium]
MQEDRLRAALPFLRPRTEEPTGIVLLFFIVLCIGILSLVALYFWRKRKQRLKLQTRFGKLGVEKGLAQSQILYLVQLAWQHRMNDPLLLLNSTYAFDRIVGRRAAEVIDTPDEIELDDISSIRTALGFDRLPPDQPLRTTRQFATGLTIMAWHEEAETFYPWILVGRDERGLTVAPLFRKDYARFDALERGDLFTARIWRKEDTEYRFSSEILTMDSSSLIATLHHDDSIERLQQRDFYRLDIQFDITFHVAGRVEEGEEDEEGPHELAGQTITGQVLNLSAGGLSTLVDQPVATGCLLRIDSACNQPFLLGNLHCAVMQGSAQDASTNLQLRFCELPPERERELVRQIYQHQTETDAMAAKE